MSLGSLVPCNVDIALKLQLIDANRFFTTQTAGIKPIYNVKDSTLYLLACILTPEALMTIHKRLHGSNGNGGLEFPFMRDTAKSYT